MKEGIVRGRATVKKTEQLKFVSSRYGQKTVEI